MASIALLFVGAVLLVNGLVFLGRIDGKAAIPINILTGSVLVLTALLQVSAVSPTSPDYRMTVFGAVGFTLFGFVYLTVGANSLFGGTGTALGWYCGWSAAIAAILAAVNFSGSTDALIAWLWVSWSVLFFSFFVALVTGAERLAYAAGLLAIIQSMTTASVPALLMIDGSWSATSPAVIAFVQIVGIIAYVVAPASRRKKSTPAVAPGREEMSAPSP